MRKKHRVHVQYVASCSLCIVEYYDVMSIPVMIISILPSMAVGVDRVISVLKLGEYYVMPKTK